MLIRKYIPSDCKPITELFYHTVHTINARDYTRQQLAAWATGNVDLEEWNQSFLAHNTIVAVKDSIIVGFGISMHQDILIGYMFTRIIKDRGLAVLFVISWKAGWK